MARTREEIVKEAKGVVQNYGVEIMSTENPGEAGCANGNNPPMTIDQARLRLMLINIELLADIRDNTAP